MKLTNINQDEIAKKAVELLKAGEVIVHPTETCYGFAVDPFNEEALEKLYEIKKMEADKPLSIMVSSVAMADKYGLFSDYAQNIVDQFWPGPVSIMVMKRKDAMPAFFNKNEKFISIRYSSDPFATQLVELLGRPIVTTSANLSGKAPCYNTKDLKEQLGVRRFDKIALIVDKGKIPENPPSTIVKIVGDTTVFVRGDGKDLGGIMR